MNFDALGRHALGELIETTSQVAYNPVSRPTGDFTALHFKQRADYPQPSDAVPATAILWDDGTPILWDDGTTIEWDN